MRRTKIICTLGPATDNERVMRELFANGMNVARLNFSHGSHDEHLKRVERFKRIRNELGVPAGLMLDTRGPEIRIRRFNDGEIELTAGAAFMLTTADISGTNRAVSVAYKGFPDLVKKGDVLLLDDGLISMRVTGVNEDEVTCEVVNGGILSNNKKINIPGVANGLPFMNDRDRADIAFGIRNDFDFIAASFVRNSNDIRELRDEIRKNGGDTIRVIAKIEIREGVENIEDIIRVSDGIMIARGDLGVEVRFEELPSIQKMIIRKCYGAGKTVITATQMLDSMMRNPRPTRAEITDVANAIYDGTSAIMLSGETSVGKYPVESIVAMSRIAVETERDIDYVKRFNDTHASVSRNVTNAISRATCDTAHTLGAVSIVSVTKSGRTADMVSRYRPACPILATTTRVKVFNQLALSWGVFPILTERKRTTDEVFQQAVAVASESDIVKTGDLIVITGGMIADVSGTTNMLKVHVVGDILLEGRGTTGLAASGPACVITGEEDIRNFNGGEILVVDAAVDEVLVLLKNASALIIEEDRIDARTRAEGKRLNIPIIIGAKGATDIIKSGIIVTVDARSGRVYSGVKNDE